MDKVLECVSDIKNNIKAEGENLIGLINQLERYQNAVEREINTLKDEIESLRESNSDKDDHIDELKMAVYSDPSQKSLDVIACLLNTTDSNAKLICELSEESEVSIKTAIKRVLPEFKD